MVWVDVEKLAAESEPSPKEKRQVEDYLARHAKPRFYSDEDFPETAVSLLRRIGARVQTVREAELAHHEDEDHVAYALRNRLILLTCDRDFLNDTRFPLTHCPAIVVFDFGSGSIREMEQAFRCLAPVFTAPQFYDKWCKIDAKRDSWTQYQRYQDGSTSRTRHRLWRGKMQEWVEGEG
jgi:predicted nuclease of predicted toxin-antitoxin system